MKRELIRIYCMQFKLLNATKYNEKSLKGMKTTNGH